MFYSVELLSLRRKSRLARCWLAATISEKMFKKTCKSASITKIDVSVLCEEILSTIEIRNGKSCGRFSLYLSSQLMYGATKLLFYQTKLFQDYLFDINWKLLEINRHKDELNLATALDVPQTPPINEVFRNVEIPLNSHLIVEEPYTFDIRQLMQYETNFGVLSSFEMENFVLPGEEESSLNDIRRFCWDQSKKILEESVQVSLVDINDFEIASVKSERDTLVASDRRDKRESSIVVEDRVSKSAPSTPKKRTLKSPAETPTKKSKISSEEVTAPQLPFLPPPSPGPVPVELPVSEFAQAAAPADALFESQLQQQLPTLEDVELIEGAQPKRRQRKLFDEQNKLTNKVMRKWLADVRAHTVEQNGFPTTLPLAKEYLTQPSVNVLEKPWGKNLTKFFSRYLSGPFITPNEFLDTLNLETEQTIHGETLRADTSSKLRDQTGELSTKFPILPTETTDQSKTTEIVLPTEDFGTKEFKEHQRKEIEESLVDLPEITGFEEKTEEAIEISDRHDSGERKLKSASKSSSSSCFKVYLTKTELLALLEIHWYEGKLVRFHDLISPDNYNKIDASCAFQYCLEFHAEKVLILKQAEPFETIWIEKYPTYSSESSVTT